MSLDPMARDAHDGHDGHDSRDRAGQPLRVGVDVGGTKIAVLVVDADDRVLAREISPTAAGAQEQAPAAIADAVTSTLAASGADLRSVSAIGVGVPGRVDPLTGTVTLAVNLGWSDLALGGELSRLLGRPCVLENDVRAAALGLHRRRVVGPVEDLAYVAVGTGVSAGVILGGRLHRGSRGLAGEIGHVIVERDGPACSCGEHGCLETFVSGPAIARRGQTAGSAVTASDVYAAAASGDRVAGAIVDDVGRRLAWAVHLLVMTYDVERVVFGGGVSHAGEAFVAPIQRELERLRATSALAREQLAPGIVDVLPAGSDAGAWGAVTIAGLGHAGAWAGDLRREVGHVPDP